MWANKRTIRAEWSELGILVKTMTNVRLKNARLSSGFTLASLAAATNGKLSTSRIANYESGVRELRVDQAKILAAALGTTASYLLSIDDASTGGKNLSEAQIELINVIEGVAQMSDLDARQITSMLKAYLQHKS